MNYLPSHRQMTTKPVMTRQIAGLTIQVYHEKACPECHEYTAIIEEVGYCEEGHTAAQALEHAFFDYCDLNVESLVLKKSDGAK